MDLTKLLSPASVVIVGASPDETRPGGRALQLMLHHGYSGRLAGVNPKYEQIHGTPCYPDVSRLPFVPDLALIGVAAGEALSALQRCHAHGIPAAVLFAAGFAELGTDDGRQRQADLEAFIRLSGMLVAGPNTFGVVNFRTKNFATFNSLYVDVPPPSTGTGLGLVSQGGGPCSIVYDSGYRRGIPFSYAIASGNEAGVKLEDYLEHLLADGSTHCVVAYIEGFEDSARFVALAQAYRDRGKPLIAYKVGTTEAGARAAASHTARLATSHAIFEAACKQLNIVLAPDLDLLSEIAYLFGFHGKRAGRRAAIVTASGALNAIFTDSFVSSGLTIEPCSDSLRARLETYLPDFGNASHPIDLSPSISTANLGKVMQAVLASEQFDFLVFFSTSALIDRWAEAFVEAAGSTNKILCVVQVGRAKCAERLQAAGIPVFSETSKASKALSAFAWWHARNELPKWRHPQPGPDHPASRHVQAAIAEGRSHLDEHEAKAWLTDIGISTPRGRLVQSRAEAAQAASEIGFPLAVKVASPDIQHKTEYGGVRLGVASHEAADAYDSVLARVRSSQPGARISGVLIEAQLPGGVEVLVAASRQRSLGIVLTLGSGGRLVELAPNVVHRLLPIDRSEAEAAIGELLISPVLKGYRGAPPADIPALADLIVQLGNSLANNADIEEVELNPVLVHERGHGVTAVDAVVRVHAG